MKYGARNNITAKVTEITSDKVMSLVKFEVTPRRKWRPSSRPNHCAIST